MANDTKERILAAALEMFSKNGYTGTNIRELSASLGLVKSGVYKHYESKEAIWNALLDEMIAYYADHFGSADRLPPVPDSLEGLVTMTMQMVNITVHDEKIIMTRKVLTLEQYRDDRARELATKHFLTGLTEIFTHIFNGVWSIVIINTGQRTDIPAFYAAWFANRLREGYVCVRNPYNPNQVSRYRLDPSVVDVIGFCTKNPAPMFPYMDFLREYGQYWFVTITPYGRDIEPNVPDKHGLLEYFKMLSEHVGVDGIGWRYDPIFLSQRYTVDYLR